LPAGILLDVRSRSVPVPQRSVDLAQLERDPFPTWASLRRSDPVAWVPEIHAHVVTRWDDVLRVSRDAETFSAVVHDSPLSRTLGPNLLHSDDPEHARDRAPLNTGLRPTAVERAVRPLVERAVRELVDGLARRTEVDLVADLADPLAHSVLRDVAGLPHVDRATMRRWVDGVGAGAANFHRDPDVDIAAKEVCDEIDEAVRATLRDGPPPGSLLAALSGGSFQQITSSVKLLVIGGMQEPRDLLGMAALAYLQEPGVRDRVDRDPAGCVPRLVEETLRWGSPVGTITRVTTRPVELSGVELPEGVVVAGVLASANRDPLHWTDPDVFDVDRDDLHHLAFAAGVHTCAGASLARLEVREALHAFLDLGAELVEQPDVRGWEFRGPTSLRVRLEGKRSATAFASTKPGVTDVVVATVTPLAEDVLGVRLTGELPPWEPGAHIDVLLPGGLVRQYSLCGAADSDAWEVAVRREEDGRGGSAWLHAHARPGLRLQVRGPRNHFALTGATEHLFVAGGIGITPLLPMLDRVPGPWRLLYVGRGRERMAFLDRLARYAGQVTVHDTLRAGRPDLQGFLATASEGAAVYACGPESLLQAVEEARPPAVPLHVERFVGVRATGGRAFSVRLARSGADLPVGADETVLDALEHSGVFLSSSCREGVCGSCEIRLLSGDPDHRDKVPAREATSFFPCVSRARTGDLVLDL
jgi:cytochrome P450/ferredoxin-NADP reductase